MICSAMLLGTSKIWEYLGSTILQLLPFGKGRLSREVKIYGTAEDKS
jgi:hypothetical protein